MMIKKLTFIVLLLSLIAGCSVKEDRDLCPCKLILNFDGVDKSLVKSLCVLVNDGDEIVLKDTVRAEKFAELFIRDVPHGRLRINIWSGGEGRIDESIGIFIPYGCECPPLYMSSFVADTGGESYYRDVDVYKNHCRLTVKVAGKDDMPYSLTFRGNIDGYGLDGLPSVGDFSCVAYPGEDGGSHSVLPRQLDSSLLMDVDDGTPVAKTFSVGEYIMASGYDWMSENLEDLTIVIDYQVTSLVISVREWDKEYSYNITL